MRKYVIFLVSLILLSGSLVSVVATQDLRDYQLRGYVDATQTTELPYRVARLGVNADLFQYHDNELEQHLDWMQTANIVWVRQFIYWDEFEPEQGQFEWDTLDTVMETLENFPQLRLIPVFMNSPSWARQNDSVTAPPDDPTAITPFLEAFTIRYGHAIDYYQIWDEPNLDDAWGLQDPRPAEYLALLAESYNTIHSHDANATVIMGALAPTTERSGQNIADNLYLQQLYDLGGADYFDAVAGKPYGFDLPPDDRTVSIDTLNFSRLILLREVMLANGDGHKAVWASHWGWNALPENWQGDPSIWGNTLENDRLDYTINALSRVEREWTWLAGMVLHHWQPSVNTDDAQWGFTVIDQDNQPRPLWQALADYDVPQASNGLYHPRNPFTDYSGLWTFSDLGADIGWLETSDSQLEFEFTGTDVALYLREGDYIAFLYPTVDEQPANAIPRDADGNSYILLRSGSQEPERNIVPIARNLTNGKHTLSIVADRGEDQWAFAGFAVSDGDLAQPYTNQIQMAWIAVLGSLCAVFASGYGLPWKELYQRLYHATSWIDTLWQFVITVMTSIALMISLLMSFGVSEPALFRRDFAEQFLLIIITGGLLVVKLPMVISLLAVLLLFWLLYHHLEWGLLLTIVYAPFFLFPVELYTFFFPMSELLILITTMAWLLRLFVQWGEERQTANTDYPIEITIKWHWFDVMMAIWVVLGIVAVFWSARLDPALTELRTFFVEPFLFYVILRTIKPDWRTIKHLVYGLIISGMMVSVIGIVLYINGDGVITAEGGARRLASVYGSPNNVGLLLGRIVPFVLAGVLVLRQEMRIVSGVVLVLLLFTVVLTQSVGALLIGVPFGIASVLIMTYGRKSLPILFGLALVGVVATFALTQVSTRFASLLDLSTGTNFIRIRVWDSSLEIIQDHPVTGLGLDQFLYEFSGHYIRPDAIFDPDLSHPHNILLDFWIRLGLLGAIWIVTFIGLFYRQPLYVWSIENNMQKTIVIGSVGSMTALISHGMIDNSIYVNDLVYIFVLLVGIMVQFSYGSSSNEHPIEH